MHPRLSLQGLRPLTSRSKRCGSFVHRPSTHTWSPWYHPSQVRNAEWLDGKDEEELEELEDDFADDRFLEQYRYI